MKIIFAGTPEPAVVALERLLDSEHTVVGVLTRPDAPRGRGRTLHPSPVAACAEKHGLRIWKPEHLRPNDPATQALLAEFQELEVACIPVVAYGQLLKPEVIAAIPHGWINLHYSLLPQWRGAAPVQAALRAGQDSTGISIFQIDAGLDTGDILAQQTAPIAPAATADDLLTTLAYQGADLLVEVLDGIAAGTVQPRPQEGSASYAPKITVADARIDWTQPATDIVNQVRSVTPGPGAWTTWQEQRVKLPAPLQPSNAEVSLAPGAVCITKQGVYIGTGTEPLEIVEIQMPGKKRMRALDWARGVHQDAAEGMMFV